MEWTWKVPVWSRSHLDVPPPCRDEPDAKKYAAVPGTDTASISRECERKADVPDQEISSMRTSVDRHEGRALAVG
jgi:hypothetical protein